MSTVRLRALLATVEKRQINDNDGKYCNLLVCLLICVFQVTGVEGDPGMGTDEDKDLYTTRGN